MHLVYFAVLLFGFGLAQSQDNGKYQNIFIKKWCLN